MTPVWIIDPIDGTNNYSRQLPNFVVSIGVAVAGITQVGVIYDAVHDELFRAAARKGSSLNGQRIRVSDTTHLRDVAVMFDWGHSRAKREMTFDALGRLLHEVHTFRSIGASALTLSWLAAGRIDAFFQYSLQIWDVAAAGLILIEAGGTMSGLNGDAWQLQAPHTSAIASNGKIHAKLLAKLTETE
jgi:myo-inositol-1(or 4)-monophosphatase